MATRSLIGIKLDNNIIKTIYCHWDGYPEHNGQLLVNNYTSPMQVEMLIEGGDLSSLGETIELSNPYSRRGDSWELIQPREVDMEHLNAVAYECNAEYVYVFNDECEWECYEYDYTNGELDKIEILAAVA